MSRLYKHENGYSAKLYGKSSMSIFAPDGKERMHTGFRACNTEKEVMEVLENMPKMLAMLMDVSENDCFDDDEV